MLGLVSTQCWYMLRLGTTGSAAESCQWDVTTDMDILAWIFINQEKGSIHYNAQTVNINIYLIQAGDYYHGLLAVLLIPDFPCL